KVKPEIAIAVDVCVANDVPGNQNTSISYLGKGPQISCYDHGYLGRFTYGKVVSPIFTC
ncbi:hypothetical protein OC725_02860, partial ['Bituminaria bituminosa' little leaf phytoplasma]